MDDYNADLRRYWGETVGITGGRTERLSTHWNVCYILLTYNLRYELNSCSGKEGLFVFNVYSGKEGLLLCLFFKNKLQQQSCRFFYFQEFFSSQIFLHFCNKFTLKKLFDKDRCSPSSGTSTQPFFGLCPLILTLEQRHGHVWDCAFLVHLSCYTCLTPSWIWIDLPHDIIMIAVTRSHSRRHSVKQSGQKQTHGVLTFHRDAQNGCK